jgi:hypothetical protein
VAEKAHAGADKNKTALRKIDNFIPEKIAVHISSKDGALARGVFSCAIFSGSRPARLFPRVSGIKRGQAGFY